ncbi:MAG: 3-hydroxyacyl-CoA dehydrogenase family protein, partial [Oscillospiraceae bacterium]|nr:3-hydroxyacyl-CoA dehydrogenase family protein [Oscillospiraceae bacterium]
LNDVSEDALAKAEEWKESYLAGRVRKGKMTEDAAGGVRARFRIDGNLETAARDADLVVEAAIEQLDIKRALFARLDEITKSQAILATNSSFIVSSKLAGATKRPDKVANLHFFNPALVMKLVEVVMGVHSSEDTAQHLMAFAEKCGKFPILIRKEIDGFIVNSLQRAITEEAFFLVENGYVTPQELDAAAEKGLNYPLGPFRLMDMTGIDISYLSRVRRYEETGDETQKPPKFLEEKYKKGELGKKTGKGWYDYSEK